MIRIVRGRIVWNERDTIKMSHVLGADMAVTRFAPLIPSILRAARNKGVEFSHTAKLYLEDAVLEREHLEPLRKVQDGLPVEDKLESRAFPHQRQDLHFIRQSGRNAILNKSDTGVGKTLVAMLWAHNIVRSKRTLVITKNNAKDQWAEAIRWWVGKWQKITIVDGTIPQQIEQAQTPAGWVVGHWQSLAHAESGYRVRPWDAIILDEAQYMNNRHALRSMVVFKLKADNRMITTAHPFSAHPGEMFSLLRFLYPDLYRSYWRFFHMHVKASPRAFGGFDIQGARRPKLLAWEIAPFTINHTKQEVFKSLPRITRSARNVTLTANGQREYARLKKAFFAELDALEGGSKYVPIINDLVRLTRIRQYLVDPGLIGGRERSLKYDAVFELLDEITKPTVIFTSFRQAAHRLGAYLTKQHLSVDYIDGGVKKAKRGEAKKHFLSGDLNALIVVAESGDTALNLGKFGYLIHLDLPWNVRGLQQAEGRVDRPEENTGKMVPTTAYRIIVNNSYEGKLEHRLSRQDSTINDVFTVKDYKELFA